VPERPEGGVDQGLGLFGRRRVLDDLGEPIEDVSLGRPELSEQVDGAHLDDRRRIVDRAEEKPLRAIADEGRGGPEHGAANLLAGMITVSHQELRVLRLPDLAEDLVRGAPPGVGQVRALEEPQRVGARARGVRPQQAARRPPHRGRRRLEHDRHRRLDDPRAAGFEDAEQAPLRGRPLGQRADHRRQHLGRVDPIQRRGRELRPLRERRRIEVPDGGLR
jgi:hypothetical protein